MLQNISIRQTVIPLVLAILFLVFLNIGLYTRLSSQPINVFALPYQENFETLAEMSYEEFGGDWEIRDETLVQLSTTGSDLTSYIPLGITSDTTYFFETDLQYLGGSLGGGLIFNAQGSTSRQRSHMFRFNVDNNQLWLIYGYFGDDSNFQGQGSVLLDLSIDTPDVQRLRVQVNQDTYDIALNGELIATNIPLQYRGGNVGLISSASQIAFDNIVADFLSDTTVVENVPIQSDDPLETNEPTPLPTTIAETNDNNLSVSIEDNFDSGTGGESLWRPISGQWEFSNSAYNQVQSEGFDLLSIYQRQLSIPYTLETAFTHNENFGAGIMFGLPNNNQRNGGYMVRYVDTGDFLTWGYFDETGAFTGVGSVTVPIADDELHQLQVSVNDVGYSITLDNETLTDVIPYDIVPPSSHYTGLTASNSVVAFDVFKVLTSTNQSTEINNSPSIANIDTNAATGNWQIVDNRIVQSATELTDYIAGTGIAGESYTVSVDIQLPLDNPDVGAGLVIHMDGRDTPNLGYLVRIGDSGQVIFWGQYNADGVFEGAGNVPIEIDPTQIASLTLQVTDQSFDILLDEERLVEAIPLQRSSGWIGMVSFGGVVEFTNLSVTLQE